MLHPPGCDSSSRMADRLTSSSRKASTACRQAQQARQAAAQLMGAAEQRPAQGHGSSRRQRSRAAWWDSVALMTTSLHGSTAGRQAGRRSARAARAGRPRRIPPWAPTRCPRSSSAHRPRRGSCLPACRCGRAAGAGRHRGAGLGRARNGKLTRSQPNQRGGALGRRPAQTCAGRCVHMREDKASG